MIQPVFEKISYSKKIASLKEQLKINAKTNVLTDDVLRVISVQPFANVEHYEAEKGRVKVEGKVTFFVCYIDKENCIKKCECGSVFNCQMQDDLIKEDCSLSVNLIVEKAGAVQDGATLNLESFILVSTSVFEMQEQSALCGGQDVFVKEKQVEVCRGLGNRTCKYPITEQFELDYQVEQVLSHSASAVITAVQSGVNCIIVDGQALLSLVLLQKNQKTGIIKVCKTLPFRMEIECEDAMPNMMSTARVKEQSIKTDVGVDETNNISTVSVSINLEFVGQTYLKDQVVVASDVFSLENHLVAEKSLLTSVMSEEGQFYTFMLNGRANTEELPLSARIMATCAESINVISLDKKDNGILITGVYYATAILVDNEDNVSAKKLEIPFEKTIECALISTENLECEIKPFRGSAKIISATEVELDCEVFFNLYPSKRCEYDFISEVTEGEKKEQKQTAISVYLSQGGEELFALSKRLNVCPEDLLKANSDLQFPLTGKERIVVYRQKQ